MLVTLTETIEVTAKPGKPVRFHAGELADVSADLAALLVARGHALYVPRPSLGTLVRDEARAIERVTKATARQAHARRAITAKKERPDG